MYDLEVGLYGHSSLVFLLHALGSITGQSRRDRLCVSAIVSQSDTLKKSGPEGLILQFWTHKRITKEVRGALPGQLGWSRCLLEWLMSMV